jgi:hypothetical protein
MYKLELDERLEIGIECLTWVRIIGSGPPEELSISAIYHPASKSKGAAGQVSVLLRLPCCESLHNSQ